MAISAPMSFFDWGLGKVLDNDILFPSNCVSRSIDDKGSIAKSITKQHLLDAVVRTDHSAGLKFLRGVARIAIVAALMLTAAPLGVAYHSFKCGQNYWQVRHFEHKDFKAHLDCMGKDLFVFVIGCLALWTFKTYFASVAGQRLYSGIGSSIFALGSGVLSCPTWYGHLAIRKSFELKNEFGLVGPNHKALTFHPEEDREFYDGPYNSTLGKIYLELSLDVLKQVQEIKRSVHFSFHYPFKSETIEAETKRTKVYTPEVQQQLNQLKKTLRAAERLKEVFKTMKNGEVDSKKAKILEGDCYPKTVANLVFNQQLDPSELPTIEKSYSDLMNKTWNRKVVQFKGDVRNVDPSKIECPEIKLVCYSIKDANPTPYRILCLTNDATDQSVISQAESYIKVFNSSVNVGNPLAYICREAIEFARDFILDCKKYNLSPVAKT